MKKSTRKLDNHLHVRLPGQLRSRVREFADERWMNETTAIRYLIGRRLEAETGKPVPGEEPDAGPPAALAALVAAEHTLVLLSTIVPEGERRMIELAPAAAEAADKRLHILLHDLVQQIDGNG